MKELDFLRNLVTMSRYAYIRISASYYGKHSKRMPFLEDNIKRCFDLAEKNDEDFILAFDSMIRSAWMEISEKESSSLTDLYAKHDEDLLSEFARDKINNN